jgi:GNAT superfamily N-acetyltransferase
MTSSEPAPGTEERGGAGSAIGAGEPAPPHPLTARVRTAHGDAWQVEGRLRAELGGGALELPGIRLMASGIAKPQWNNGDVTDPALVDIEAVRAWYADRSVPWGVRVPAGLPWPYGRHLFAKRCMGLRPDRFRPAEPLAGLEVRPLSAGEVETYAEVDAAAFGEDEVGPTLAWTRPMLGADGFRLALARLDGEPVGVGYGVRSSGTGGESVGVFGVGVLPTARRKGIGAVLTTYVVQWGFATGADLAWLNPDTDEAARLYDRMGFEETGGLDVYVDN